MSKKPAVYIMASDVNGTLYTGVTSDLVKRIWQHKNGAYGGFTDKYDIKMLVYYEMFENMEEAIVREKRLKDWKRMWKMRLIMEMNPKWEDLYDSICN